MKITRDVFMYRAYIAQRKYTVPLDEITGVSPPELQVIRTYADYLANPPKRFVIKPFLWSTHPVASAGAQGEVD